MALAGRSRLVLGLVFLWSTASLVAVGDAYGQQWHYPTYYTESEEVHDMQKSVIQPIVKKSAQLATYKDDEHRFKRDTLPINYRSLTSDQQGSSVAPHCSAWSQSHFRTFDGKTYNFHGACQYTLLLDCRAYMFRISIQNDFECFTPGEGASCNRTVVVRNGDTAMPIYLRPGLVVGHNMQRLDLPTSLDGLVLEKVGDSIMVTSGLGYKLVYDGDEAVTVYITSDNLHQQTCGLCGVYNDNPSDDFKGPIETYDDAYDFGLSWKEDASCEDIPRPAVLCTEIFIPPHLVHLYKDFIDLSNFAKETCKALEDDAAFTSCYSVVDVSPYIEACKRDMCNCKNGQDECSCNSMTAYAQECARYGVTLDWRTTDQCPWICPSGTVYHSCGTTCTQMCGSVASDCEEDLSVGCIEGCRCRSDEFLNSDGQCIKEEECPCISNGVEYDTGSTISDGCNQCTCNSGKWTCSDKICETLCWASGDPHYKTFDDNHFNFMGECSYHLVKDCWDDNDKFEIIVDNAPCGHPGVTCTQKVIIRNADDYVTLFRNHRVTTNGNDVITFPYVREGIMVDRPTNLLTVVTLGNDMVVRWDGKYRVEIVAPPSKFNRTCGLCGTFNKNRADDFMTPAGERVASADAFGNSWKVSNSDDNCPDVPPDSDPPDVCELYSQRKQIAYEQCNKLISEPVFQPCHRVLDPDEYVQDCRYDVCNGNGNDDHCSMFSQYVSDCRQKDVILTGWRKAIPDCDVECDVPGMSYSECAPSCETSCSSIHAMTNGAYCLDVCVEGCHCVQGNVVSYDGVCIPADQCPCYDEFQWFETGETIQRDCQTCTCNGGRWHCDQVSCPVITCPKNQFYSECSSEVECQPTCDNFHDPPSCDGKCMRACECAPGYVLHNEECVAKVECPCTYKGEVYEPNEVVRVGCQICTCENGEMKCHNDFCPGTCIASGDPHYQTFDGKKYNFQGECDYVLVTNSHYQVAKQFHIVVANVPCGSGGVTCTKAITIAIGTGAEQEKVMLVRGKPIEVDTGIGGLSEFTISEAGLYIFVHTNIGVTLRWDRATRVEVKVTKEHFSRVGGLCGNYNDMQRDDFLPPGGGIPLIDANDFGNSWKVHDYCGNPGPDPDPCEENPHRKTWAQRKCSIINSPLFGPCHQYVPPAQYFANCVYDSCGCDAGGDCECMCTAIATYAQMCNEHGVPIKWRSQDLCPIQCEGCLTYQPCIPVCESSCENQAFALPSGPCIDTCVDGCACPPGTTLHNDECIEECPPVPTTVLPTFQEPSTGHPSTRPPPSSIPPTTQPQPQPTTPGKICECWGYGDPHYFDFNGVEFNDQGICTYVLAKDLNDPPRFVVLIHNIECGLFPGTTCPRELEVLFDGYRIRMLAERNDQGEYQIIIDGTTYTLPIETFDSFTVTQAGLYMLFDAPSISLQVRYLPVDLHFFKVEIPQVIYYNSTEGLCGNCGIPQPPCEETSSCCDWLAPPSVPSECGCDVEPTQCVPGPDIIDWCDKLYEDIFSECHDVIDPDVFYKTCLYNSCYGKKPTCWDFEAYVTECSAVGICIDWREDDFCPYDCKNDETHYRECACPDDIYTSCFPWDKEPHLCDMEPVSGCFCNEGSMDNGNGTCIPCPTDIYPTTRAKTTVYTTESVKSTTPEATTRPIASTTVESTPPESTTVESTPPESTTVESTPPESTTVESTPPESTTVESTPPESTTIESTPPESTTVESTPPESTTVESTPPESTPPQATTKPHPPESTPAAPTTVESTPPESTTVESTPPESTTVESTPPESTTVESTPPESTTVESTPPESTTVESTPPESTTVESTPPESTTVESTPPESTTVESTPPESTTVESTPPESTTVESTPPESTTVESTPPESTTVESTPPESTTVESTPPESTPPQATTKPHPPESTPAAPTTVESTPPESTTVESTPPESTTVESTPPESTTVESTPPESTTVESTPPESTTVESTPPESTTVEVVETTTECIPGPRWVCEWSDYLDDEQDHPNTQPYEFEFIEDFLNDERYHGVCAEPEAIECVLARDHNVPASMTTQLVKCNTDLGLACYSGDTQECLDYAIRIKCCWEEYVVCGSTVEPPTQPESTIVVESTTPEKSSTPSASTTVESTLPPVTTLESTTEEPPTTVCVPHHENKCEWTRYYDDSDSPHGDFEVIGDLRDAHPGEICESPMDVDCVLSSDHSISAHQTGQNFTCLPSVGFLCVDFANNWRPPFECYDYSVRFLCCESVYITCGSTEETPTTMELPTTEPNVPTTEPVITTESVVTTEESTTECVDVVEKSCKWTPWLDDEEEKVGPLGEFELISSYRENYDICDTPFKIECVLKSNPSMHSNQTGQVVTCDVDEGLVCLHSEQTDFPPFCFDYMIRVECCQEIVLPCYYQTTEEVVTTKPVATTREPEPTTKEKPTIKPVPTTKVVPTEPPKESTTPPASTLPLSTTEEDITTACKPVYEEVCEWLPWMDDDTGHVGPIGEFELISTFRDQYDICEEPRQIECALKSDHNLHANMMKQNVICSPTEGLICLHSDQPDIPRCFDYSIRLQCCSFVNIGCPTTPEPQVTTVESTTQNVPSSTAPPHNNEKCRPDMSGPAIIITKDSCSSPTPVFLPRCHGRCESYSSFNGFDGNGNEYWRSTCHCCRPSAYEVDHYELLCPDGETITQPINIVTKCSCTEFECPV